MLTTSAVASEPSSDGGDIVSPTSSDPSQDVQVADATVNGMYLPVLSTAREDLASDSIQSMIANDSSQLLSHYLSSRLKLTLYRRTLIDFLQELQERSARASQFPN